MLYLIKELLTSTIPHYPVFMAAFSMVNDCVAPSSQMFGSGRYEICHHGGFCWYSWKRSGIWLSELSVGGISQTQFLTKTLWDVPSHLPPPPPPLDIFVWWIITHNHLTQALQSVWGDFKHKFKKKTNTSYNKLGSRYSKNHFFIAFTLWLMRKF